MKKGQSTEEIVIWLIIGLFVLAALWGMMILTKRWWGGLVAGLF